MSEWRERAIKRHIEKRTPGPEVAKPKPSKKEKRFILEGKRILTEKEIEQRKDWLNHRIFSDLCEWRVVRRYATLKDAQEGMNKMIKNNTSWECWKFEYRIKGKK